MYINSKDGLGAIKNPEGGHLSHILKYGIISHNNISLTYFQCLEHHDNLGAFICLIMLTHPEKNLRGYYITSWDHLPYDRDKGEFVMGNTTSLELAKQNQS